MALSAAAHHSYDKVVAEEKYYGQRAQKTDSAKAAHNAPRRQTKRAARGSEHLQSYEEEPGGGRPASLPEVAGPQARHRGAARRCCARGPVTGCSCAAAGGPAGGRAYTLRSPCSRTSYRSAQGLVAIPRVSYGSERAADGGTAGGSADDRASH